MSAHTFTFSFSIGDKIILKEIQRPGVVDALMVVDRGLKYNVIYWNDSKRESEWCYEWEIERRVERKE